MITFTYAVKDSDGTLEQLLRDDWKAGKKNIHELRMANAVTEAEGVPAVWRTPLIAGTELTFHLPEAHSEYEPLEVPGVKILQEDAHFIAVFKPAGIAVHPDGTSRESTMMNAVMAHIQEQGGTYAEHIQRLDKGTSGIVIVAKHPMAKAMFDRMIASNEITRLYNAEVEGRLKRLKGSVNMPIGRDRHHPTRRRVSMSGQTAVTHFKVIERKEDTTLIEATLDTGRTHQIRVHMAHLGHPVVGDNLYEASALPDGSYRLTAVETSFIHPFTGEKVVISTL
ncbi:RluA family pseudouridine synthase [Sporosarcina sp. A2]|uniref:RluA family pseudouridine synthase n=1 Tax=Sporosarcina sp. A2 TaxID=3393449 RepID=UPI003D78FA7A